MRRKAVRIGPFRRALLPNDQKVRQRRPLVVRLDIPGRPYSPRASAACAAAASARSQGGGPGLAPPARRKPPGSTAQEVRKGARGGLEWRHRARILVDIAASGGNNGNDCGNARAWLPPSFRRWARMPGTPPDRLEAKEQTFLGHLASAMPDLARTGELTTAFMDLLRERRAHIGSADAAAALKAWMEAVRVSLLDGFACGLVRNRERVVTVIATP